MVTQCKWRNLSCCLQLLLSLRIYDRTNLFRYYDRDSKSTVSFILGSTVGEAVIPVCIGFIMAFVSPNAMNICVLVSAVVMIVIYLGSDRMMKSHFGDGDCDTADEVAVMKPVCNGFHDAIIEDDGCS